jgi:hypothetical protein
MPATAQQIIDNAYAKSAAARPEQTAAPAELLARIGQALREWGQIAARENPYLLGTDAEVAFGTVGWPRPADCYRVIEVRTTPATVISPVPPVGTRLTIVPWDDQGLGEGTPSVTELGQQFRPTGQPIDPSNGTLQILYARSLTTPQTTTSTIDPLFPEWAYDYLQFDLAAYLASKEERKSDEEVFYAGKNANLQALIEWMRGQTYTLTQRFPITVPPLTNIAGGRQQPAQGS